MNKFIGLTAACALLFAASSASAITYVANRVIVQGAGQAFLNLSITTDNTLGVLSAANIVGWSVQATASGNHILQLEGPGGANNSSWYVQGTHLTATTTDLYFDFTQPNSSIHSAILYGTASGQLYCLMNAGCLANYTGEGLRFSNNTSITRPVSGNQIIASAAGGAVPEPGAWALMLAGFGLAGSALRARRRTLAA